MACGSFASVLTGGSVGGGQRRCRIGDGELVQRLGRLYLAAVFSDLLLGFWLGLGLLLGSGLWVFRFQFYLI